MKTLFRRSSREQTLELPDEPQIAPLDLDLDTASGTKPPSKKRPWWWVNPFPSPSTSSSSAIDAAEWTRLKQTKGYRTRQSDRKAKRGWYSRDVEPALTSSRQAEVLNPALISPSTGFDGVLIGSEVLTNAPVCHDPFTAYQAKRLSSPNVIVLGSIGEGKSSLLKTVYVLRQLILRKRRAVVFDKKPRGGEGEYAELTREYGEAPFKFAVGGGEGTCRLNLLDEMILAGDGVAGQLALLRTIAELGQDGRSLDSWEQPALRVAHRETLRICEADGREPQLEDLVNRLGVFDPKQFEDYSADAFEKLHQAGLQVRHLLAGLLSDELSGLFDGPTSKNINLNGRLTTFDISQLPEDGPAVSMVMAAANTWLLGMLKYDTGWLTTQVVEEGWHLLGGAGGRLMQRNQKLARALGLVVAAALHHPADIPADSPAISIIKEAGTAHLYAQGRSQDAIACQSLFNLHRGAEGLLGELTPGHHLLKIGSNPEIHVRHELSSWERRLIETDAAMLQAAA